jgi:hypothetical protein
MALRRYAVRCILKNFARWVPEFDEKLMVKKIMSLCRGPWSRSRCGVGRFGGQASCRLGASATPQPVLLAGPLSHALVYIKYSVPVSIIEL